MEDGDGSKFGPLKKTLVFDSYFSLLLARDFIFHFFGYEINPDEEMLLRGQGRRMEEKSMNFRSAYAVFQVLVVSKLFTTIYI